MAESGESGSSIARMLKLVRLALAGTGAGILAMLLPEVPRTLPLEVQFVLGFPLVWLVLALVPACLGVEWLAGLPPVRWAIGVADRARTWSRHQPIVGMVGSGVGLLSVVDRFVDRAAARLIGPPIAAALGVACAVLLLTWAPHYLTLPLWADVDQFAISAQSWDAGILPYRDLADFDFPGPIYELYVLGRLFGWGRTVPFFAADLGLLLLLGGAMLAWSRRQFGSWIPGLIGFLSWLAYYLGRDFTQAGQRDWQGPALAVLGLMALESLPGRVGRPLSALALAGALALRPQPVLFGPAFLSAMEESASGPGGPVKRTIRAAAWWSAAMAIALALVFLPLIADGVFDDFVNALRITRYGGSYNHTGWYSFYNRFQLLFWDGWTTPLLTTTLVLLGAGGPIELRRPARTWLLAVIGALCYQPISPVAHDYLLLPLRLLESVAMAPIAAWLLNGPRLTPSVRLAGLIVLVATGVPGWPKYCTARGSLEALRTLTRGGLPTKAPPGCRSSYPVVTRLELRDGLHRRVSYDYWSDYRRVLNYLRRDLDRRRPVASLLRSLPIPSVNGPSGHLSPFPAGGGCMHLFLVDPSLEDRFIEALERTPGTVVVWTPDDPAMIRAMQFPRLEAAVRYWYRPCERFGHIEVWVRSDERARCRCGTSGDEGPRGGP